MRRPMRHLWRFSRYRLQDGVIRPAIGAALEWYDPWESWKNLRETGGSAKLRPLYAAPLVGLCRDVTNGSDYRRDWVTPEDLSAKQEARLLEWVSKNGLLFPRFPRLAVEKVGRSRTSKDEEDQKIERRRLEEEPYLDFIKRALTLTQAIEALADQTVRLDESKSMVGINRIHARELQRLASDVQPTLSVLGNGRLELDWKGTTLLSTIAMITILELSAGDGQYLGLCARCRAPFVSGDPRSIYCGDVCRQVMNKRKQRENAKLRKEAENV